jgi:hypothetical protein
MQVVSGPNTVLHLDQFLTNRNGTLSAEKSVKLYLIVQPMSKSPEKVHLVFVTKKSVILHIAPNPCVIIIRTFLGVFLRCRVFYFYP